MPGIYRYFAITSGLVVVVAMFVVSLIYYFSSVEGLVQLTERHNVALARTLGITVWSRSSEGGRDGNLVAPDLDLQAAEVGQSLRAVVNDLSILKVKLYSPQGVILYSSGTETIGENRYDQAHPEIFKLTAEAREPQSEFTRKDSITAFSGEVFDRDVVETYVPILGHDATMLGVFEIYTDVTATKQRIDRQIIQVAVGLLFVFGLLYGALVLIVKRRVITPLQQASQAAAAIGPHSSGARIPTGGIPGEVLPLIETINEVLGELDQALDVQRQFAADAAHELLTPLAVLRANLDTLSDEREAAALRQDLAAMTNIVTQLLELTELEAWNKGVGEPVDLRKVCVEVISMLAPIALKDGKSIELSGPETVPPVRCCANSLSRALRNLIENAVAHTAPGTAVDVHLGTDGSIQVIDRGPGIPPADREKIFQRFWRGSDKHRPGSGLGLSIVRRFAETFEGSISVDDAPGGGAVFTLQLPLYEGTNP